MRPQPLRNTARSPWSLLSQHIQMRGKKRQTVTSFQTQKTFNPGPTRTRGDYARRVKISVSPNIGSRLRSVSFVKMGTLFDFIIEMLTFVAAAHRCQILSLERHFPGKSETSAIE